ncbi:MAG: ParB N-terminal domain-containing protein [Kiritimatiellia bacterium]
MRVPVSSIQIPDRVRKEIGDLKPLMESLQRIGQLNPITITPEYQLVAGFRRLSAARALGWRTIEVRVIEGADEVRILEMELEENVYRKDFTPEEVLAGWKRLEALKHPKLGRRIGSFFKNVFSKLCFWRNKKKISEHSAASSAVPEAATSATERGAVADDEKDSPLGI